MKQIIEYFKGFNEEDNITITCDFITNIEELIEEDQELNKQLEEANTTLDTHNELINYMENQQKEFIEYLEYQIQLQDELNDKHLATGFEEILVKFKEIIGVENE